MRLSAVTEQDPIAREHTHRVLVTGSRAWQDTHAVRAALDVERAAALWKGLAPVLVHGACPTGADAIAAEHAVRTGGRVEPHPADWRQLGLAAGPIRNMAMVAAGADICLGFPLGASKGTRGCMAMATAAGIQTLLIEEGFAADSDWGALATLHERLTVA